MTSSRNTSRTWKAGHHLIHVEHRTSRIQQSLLMALCMCSALQLAGCEIGTSLPAGGENAAQAPQPLGAEQLTELTANGVQAEPKAGVRVHRFDTQIAINGVAYEMRQEHGLPTVLRRPDSLLRPEASGPNQSTPIPHNDDHDTASDGWDAQSIAIDYLEQIKLAGVQYQHLGTNQLTLPNGQIVQTVHFEARHGEQRFMDSDMRVMLVDGKLEQIVGLRHRLVEGVEWVLNGEQAADAAILHERNETGATGEIEATKTLQIQSSEDQRLFWSVTLSHAQSDLPDQSVLVDGTTGAVISRMTLEHNAKGAYTDFKVKGALNHATATKTYNNGKYFPYASSSAGKTNHTLEYTGQFAIFDGGGHDGTLNGSSQEVTAPLPKVSYASNNAVEPWTFNTSVLQFKKGYLKGPLDLASTQHSYYWLYRGFKSFYLNMYKKVGGATLKKLAVLTNMPPSKGTNCGSPAYRSNYTIKKKDLCPTYKTNGLSDSSYADANVLILSSRAGKSGYYHGEVPEAHKTEDYVFSPVRTKLGVILHEYGHHVDEMYGGISSTSKKDNYCDDNVKSSEINACMFQVAVIPGLTNQYFDYEDYASGVVGYGCEANTSTQIKMENWSHLKDFNDQSLCDSPYRRTHPLLQGIFAAAANMRLTEACINQTANFPTVCTLGSSNKTAATRAQAAVAYVLANSKKAPTQQEAADLFIQYYELNYPGFNGYIQVLNNFKALGHDYGLGSARPKFAGFTL